MPARIKLIITKENNKTIKLESPLRVNISFISVKLVLTLKEYFLVDLVDLKVSFFWYNHKISPLIKYRIPLINKTISKDWCEIARIVTPKGWPIISTIDDVDYHQIVRHKMNYIFRK